MICDRWTGGSSHAASLLVDFCCLDILSVWNQTKQRGKRTDESSTDKEQTDYMVWKLPVIPLWECPLQFITRKTILSDWNWLFWRPRGSWWAQRELLLPSKGVKWVQACGWNTFPLGFSGLAVEVEFAGRISSLMITGWVAKHLKTMSGTSYVSVVVGLWTDGSTLPCLLVFSRRPWTLRFFFWFFFNQQCSCFVAASRASHPYRLYVAVFQTPLAGCLLGGDRRQKFLRVGDFVWESSPVRSIHKVLLTSQIVTLHQGRRINNDQ